MPNEIQTGSRPKGVSPVDPGLVDRLREMVDSRTDKALTAQLGISYNTWRKLMAGQPVRTSLLRRLQSRIDSIDAGARG